MTALNAATTPRERQRLWARMVKQALEEDGRLAAQLQKNATLRAEKQA